MGKEKDEQGLIVNYTEGNIMRQMIRFAGPLFLCNFIQVIYNMVDIMVVGQVVGKAGLSGVTVGGDVLSFIMFIAVGFSNAGQVVIAQHIGAGQREKIGRIVGNLFSFLFIAAVILTVVCLVFRTAILNFMNTPDEAWDSAYAYTAVCSTGLIFIYGYNAVSAVFRGLGDSKHPFFIIAGAAILNVILDLLFVAVFGLGAGGAALATVISQGVSFLLAALFLYKRKDRLGISIKAGDFIFDRDILPVLLKQGIPMAIRSAAIMFSKLIIDSRINTYGVVASSVSGIEGKFNSVSNLFSNAVHAAVSTMIGQNIGAKNYSRVSKIILRAFLLVIVLISIIGVLLLLFPDTIYSLFSSDAEVIEACLLANPLMIVLCYGCAFRAPMNGFVAGTGNYKLNFVVAILDAIVFRIGLAFLLGEALGMGWTGYLWGDALSGFTPFFIGGVYYLSGSWKRKQYIIK